MIRSNESMAKTSDNAADEDGFFQSKMSVASKISRAASKESGMNRMRTHTNSFSRLPNTDVSVLAGSAGSGLAMAGVTTTASGSGVGDRPSFDIGDIVQQVVRTDPEMAERYKRNVEREQEREKATAKEEVRGEEEA